MAARRLVLACAALGGLAACSPPARDVAYYRDHADARAQTLASCRNDQGKVAANANCINALAADGAATSKAFWTVRKPASRVQAPGKL